MHVLIAGAGIGGLTAAVALNKQGHRITLIERAPELSETGAGLQLSPNATAILDDIGVLEAVWRRAIAPDMLRVWRGRDGAEIMRMPLGALAETRWKSPSLVIHRADLQRTLLERLKLSPRVDLITGSEVLGFAAAGNGIQVGARNASGNIRVDGDILIGADGLHSAVRARLGLGEADRPVYSGRTAWRALLEGTNAPEFALTYETNLWLGPHAHLVHYPLREGEVVNIVAIVEDDWRGAGEHDFWNAEGNQRYIANRFGRWNRRARDLLERVNSWRRWPLFDRNPVPRWSVDRVVLLGDAAHPVLPFLAQGACLAVEDAGVLAMAIERHPEDINLAIHEYEQRRIVRAAEIRIASRRQGAIYHMGGLPARARDMVMGALPRDRLMSRMDWVYNYQVS